MPNKCEKCNPQNITPNCRAFYAGICDGNPKPAPTEKRVFEFGQFSFKTQAEFNELITKLWAEGKTPKITVEVLK